MARKKSYTWLWLGGLGLLAFGGRNILQKFVAVYNLQFEVSNIKVVKIGQSHTEALLTLSVVNPSNRDLQFKQFFATINYKQTLLSTVRVERLVDVPARQITAIKFPLSINHLKLVDQVLDFIQTRQIDQVMVDGTININNTSYPIHTSVSLS